MARIYPHGTVRWVALPEMVKLYPVRIWSVMDGARLWRQDPGMKMLMLHVSDFWYRTHCRNLETEEERQQEATVAGGAVLAWIHVEPHDLDDRVTAVRKAIKNLKWHARKVEVEQVVLHSFAHLAEQTAEPEASRSIIEEVGERLVSVGFQVHHTPWGYFNEFKMHVEGPGIAKVFKSF